MTYFKIKLNEFVNNVQKLMVCQGTSRRLWLKCNLLNLLFYSFTKKKIFLRGQLESAIDVLIQKGCSVLSIFSVFSPEQQNSFDFAKKCVCVCVWVWGCECAIERECVCMHKNAVSVFFWFSIFTLLEKDYNKAKYILILNHLDIPNQLN